MLDRPYRPEPPVLRARATLLVAPQGDEGMGAARRLQAGIAAAAGERLSIVPASALDDRAWTTHDLVVLGDLNSSAAAKRLYTRSHAFADGLFPGGDGYHVHTVADPFGSGRGCFVLGASTPGGVQRAIDAFCRAVGERGPAPGRLSLLASGYVDVPVPDAADLARVQADCHRRFLAGTGVLSVHRAIEAGLLFQLTGDRAWAEHFRAILFDYMALAAEHGTYAFEHMLFIYSWIWKLVAVWDLIEDAPVFGDADRLAFGNCLLALGRYAATLPYWTQPDVPEPEPRQNHQTFAALSLDAVATYLRKAYAVTELDPLLPAARQIMAGQLTSYKPNDDAGGTYVWLVPRHVLRYTLRHGDERFVRDGRLRDLAELAILTTDNRRDECTYGDTMEYRPSGEARPLSLQILSAAAHFYRDGRFAWALDWLSPGADFARSRTLEQPESWSEFYDGRYATAISPEYPADLTGVRAVRLDAGALGWIDRRAEALGWRRDPSKTYFDKIAFRRDFDPDSEYLCLEGPSSYAHGHRDGNSITRLTWRDRIWLADLDYIRHHARYHSSVVVVRDGCDAGPPPLTELGGLANLPGLGESTTVLRDYNGATWQRQILWLKGDGFLVVDEIEAQRPGEYFTECLWRLLGDVSIEGRRAVATQSGETLVVASGDGSSLSLHEEEPRLSSWDRYPHARGGVRVLRQRHRATMHPGDRRRYVNLIAAGGPAGGADRGYGVRAVRDGLYEVERDGGHLATVLHPRRGAIAGAGAEADLLLVREGSIAALRCTALSVEDGAGTVVRLFTSSTPVDVEAIPDSGELVVRAAVPGTVRLYAGGDEAIHPVPAGESVTIPLGAPGAWAGLAAAVVAAAAPAVVAAPAGAAPAAPGDGPDSPSPLVSVAHLWRAPSPITALAVPAGAAAGGSDSDGLRVVAGTAAGDVSALAGGGEVLWRAGLDGPILSLLAGDVDGDGGLECVAGTGAAELALLDARGVRRWRTALEPAHNRAQKVTALAVADLDGRGRRSLLAATEGWLLHAFDAGGRLAWRSWIEHHAATFCAVADVDGDGRPEIVYGTLDNLVCAAGADGSLLWSADVGGEVAGLAYDGAPDPAIYALSAYGDLFRLDGSGQRIWRRHVGDEATRLALGRGPGGVPVAVVGTAGGRVLLYGAGGERLARVTLGDAPVTHLVSAPAGASASILYAASGSALAAITLAT